MSSTTLNTSSDDTVAVGPTRRRPGWAISGLVAGLAGIVGIGASTATGASRRSRRRRCGAITERLSEMVPQILVFHTATMVSSLLLLVFAAGLRRQLGQRVAADSLLPGIAASGLLLVSVAGLMGAGLTTGFVFGVSDPDLLVPETGAFFGHRIGTIRWVWAGAGVAALAVASAALRHGAYARVAARMDFVDYVSAQQRALLRAAQAITGAQDSAEDLLQSALAKVYPRWEQIRDHRAADAYLRRVMVNQHASWYRQKWRTREHTTDVVPEPESRWSEVADGLPSATSERQRLWPLVTALPPRQRAAVALRYYEELSEAETAAALDCSVGTVKSTTNRALARLRELAVAADVAALNR